MSAYHLLSENGTKTLAYLQAYIQKGEVMPEILMDVVQNDFIKVMTSAQPHELEYLHTLAVWLYTQAPAAAIGCPQSVSWWMGNGGRQGIRAKAEALREEAERTSHKANAPYVHVLEYQPEPTD